MGIRKSFPILLRFSIQEVSQFFGAAGVAELSEGLSLDLADAFAGDAELLAHLFEGAGTAVHNSKA